MTDKGYEVAHIDELEELPINKGEFVWRPVRRRFGITAFGTNAYTANAGQRVIEEHSETGGHQELYVVLRGRATFTLDGEEVAAPAGTLVHVFDPEVKRGAVGEEGTTILVVGAKPGEAFTPSTWERSAEALRFWPTEEWDKAIAVLESHLEATPENGGVHYNLACAKARAGRTAEALSDLRRAVELQPTFAEYAQADDDLASIRDDPGFPAPPAE